MNMQALGRNHQTSRLQLDNKPAAAPAAHLLLRLKMGQNADAFDYRSSIRKLGETLKTYTYDTWNDNISVQLRDWGFKLVKLNLRDASTFKSLINELLNVLENKILVNEIDQSPLREPVLLGELMGDLADFVCEKEMLTEYLKLISVSVQSLKVHAFATDILAWAKPIADWARQDRHPEVALMPHQAGLSAGLSVGILQLMQNQKGAFEMPLLDSAWASQLQSYLNMRRITQLEQLIRGGLCLQKLKRQEVENRNGSVVAKKQNELALAALQEHLDGIEVQMDAHKKDMKAAIDTLKQYHDKEVDVLKDRHDDTVERLQETYERLCAEEKHADQLSQQVNQLQHSLNDAWARINQLANDDGGWCVIQ
jgi:hypothetical protein